MKEKVIELFNEHYNQFITWYNGLNDAYQYGFLYICGIVGFLIVVFVILSKATKT